MFIFVVVLVAVVDVAVDVFVKQRQNKPKRSAEATSSLSNPFASFTKKRLETIRSTSSAMSRQRFAIFFSSGNFHDLFIN